MSPQQFLIVLDRDGTINEDPGWFGRDPNWRQQLKLKAGVVEGIKLLNSLGKVMVATNQYGVARGYFSLETVWAINSELDKILRAQGALIDNWQVCPFVDYDWAAKQGLDLNTPWVKKGDTSLRKPNGGMIIEAAKDLGLDWRQCKIIAIGNRLGDAQTGVNINGAGIIIKDEEYLKEFEQARELSLVNPNYFLAEDFWAAAQLAHSLILHD